MTIEEMKLLLNNLEGEFSGDTKLEMCTVGKSSTVIYTISHAVQAPHENTIFFLASSYRIVPNMGDTV